MSHAPEHCESAPSTDPRHTYEGFSMEDLTLDELVDAAHKVHEAALVAAGRLLAAVSFIRHYNER